MPFYHTVRAFWDLQNMSIAVCWGGGIPQHSDCLASPRLKILTYKTSESLHMYVVWHEQEILQIVTNLITTHALFSPTYLLNLVKPELAPFDPPTPKNPSRTKHKVNRTIRRWDIAIWIFQDGGRAAILDLAKPEIAPFDPPTPKTPP